MERKVQDRGGSSSVVIVFNSRRRRRPSSSSSLFVVVVVLLTLVPCLVQHIVVPLPAFGDSLRGTGASELDPGWSTAHDGPWDGSGDRFGVGLSSPSSSRLEARASRRIDEGREEGRGSRRVEEIEEGRGGPMRVEDRGVSERVDGLPKTRRGYQSMSQIWLTTLESGDDEQGEREREASR
eukprot:9441841-Pyramimonas_sp.AAC.1